MEFALQHHRATIPTPTDPTSSSSADRISMMQTMAMPRSSLSTPSYLFTKPATSEPSYTNSAAHPTTTTFMSIHSPDRSVVLCRYPSKLCENLRSEKRGGGLHRFCAYHRERANINQRRVDHRRRLRKQGLPVPPIERSAAHSQPSTPTNTLIVVKPEQSQQEATEDDEELGLISLEGDLFDHIDAAQPLLPDLTEFDLQELMRMLDEDDVTIPSVAIKEEPQENQDEHNHRQRW